MKSAKDGNDEPEKACLTVSVNDMVISDDDSANFNNYVTLNTSSCLSTDNSSYSGSDDESIIKSDQPLFLSDTASLVSVSKNSGHGNNNGDPLLGSDVGVAGEDAAMMAEFLQDTFEPSCRTHEPSLATSPFGDGLDASEMDALLNAETEAMMLLPDLCVES